MQERIKMDVMKIESFSLGADLWSSKDLKKSILGNGFIEEEGEA